MEEDKGSGKADSSGHNTTGTPEKPSPDRGDAEQKRTPRKEGERPQCEG